MTAAQHVHWLLTMLTAEHQSSSCNSTETTAKIAKGVCFTGQKVRERLTRDMDTSLSLFSGHPLTPPRIQGVDIVGLGTPHPPKDT